jgi:hypothetical protein
MLLAALVLFAVWIVVVGIMMLRAARGSAAPAVAETSAA